MIGSGGFNASLYNDYLSEIYSGKPSIPYTLGGVNYADKLRRECYKIYETV
jgi:hypothetical protein